MALLLVMSAFVRVSGKEPQPFPKHRQWHGFWWSVRHGIGRWLDLLPFLRVPVLCWWARMIVLSIIMHSLSWSAARCWKIRWITALSHQGRSRRCTFFHSPNRTAASLTVFLELGMTQADGFPVGLVMFCHIVYQIIIGRKLCQSRLCSCSGVDDSL